MSIDGRLGRLEGELPEDGTGACPECHRSREPRVVFVLPQKNGPPDPRTGKTVCDRCGRKLALRIVLPSDMPGGGIGATPMS